MFDFILEEVYNKNDNALKFLCNKPENICVMEHVSGRDPVL